MDSPTELAGDEVDYQMDRSIDGDSIPLGFGGQPSSQAVGVVDASYHGGCGPELGVGWAQLCIDRAAPGTGGRVLGLNGIGRAVGAARVWFVLDCLRFMCCVVACQSNP
jgi:hypothetical protein